MRKKVVKYFMDYEKDEKWLNDQAEKGWNLVETNGIDFYFSDEELEKYTYRIINLEINGKRDNAELIELLKFEKIECLEINGSTCYLRKKDSDGPFELFSDLDSKIKYAKNRLQYRKRDLWSIPIYPIALFVLRWLMPLNRFEYDWLIPWLELFIFMVILFVLLSMYLTQLKRYNDLRKEHIIQE